MEDKLIPINMNWYRNAHHQVSNKVKELFKAHVQAALTAVCFQQPMPVKGVQYRLSYTLFFETNRAADVMNFGAAIDKFTCDALKELGVIKDDNFKILPGFRFDFGGIDKENPRCELTIEAI